MASSLRGHTITERVTLISETCCNCGVVFAMSDQFQAVRMEDHGWFYCPAGHSQHYTDDNKADRERKRAEQAERELNDARTRLIQERDRHAATKKTLTQAKRRAAAAVCPCCNRSFVQLRRHLDTKHPDYTGTDAAKSETSPT